VFTFHITEAGESFWSQIFRINDVSHESLLWKFIVVNLLLLHTVLYLYVEENVEFKENIPK